MRQLYQIDAFQAEGCAGNPAAVYLLDEPASEEWMQAEAARIGFSETAFLTARGDDFDLRWFTPACEVALCGHATLASAHLLDRDRVTFHTKSGALIVERDGDGFRLDFPALVPEPAPVPDGLAEALGNAAFESWRSRFDHVCVFEDAAAVIALRPDLERLANVDARGVIATAPGGRADFTSRFFGPRVGVDEDPATGSAHCVLAPFWCNRLGRVELTGHQASARGGLVRVSWEGGDRVTLAGRAVTVRTGDWSG